MPSRDLKTKRKQGTAQNTPQSVPSGPRRLTRRRVSLALMTLALVYAFLAGLHTVIDFDMGWHLATGRYVLQHHVVPSTDILSYTSPGAEWLYPPFAGVLLYGIFNVWGYAGLTWFCALALMAMVACLLRGPSRQESGLAAVLAIMAVPALALRATPRADLFTTLFFAIFLAQLWKFHRRSADPSGGRVEVNSLTPSTRLDHVEGTAALRRERLRLWILPLLMLLWVNLHPGFVAGLGILIAYFLIEGLELLFPNRRKAVLQRLQQAWPPLAATVVATLFNPYGPRIFKAVLHLADLTQPSSAFVAELAAVRLTLPSLAQALVWRNPDSSYWWLALAAVVVVGLAFWRRQFGAALLTVAALYASVQHHRYQGLFAIVVVVVGSTILTEAFQDRRQGSARVAAKRLGIMFVLPSIAAAALCLLTCVRICDLITSRYYLVSTSGVLFGAGESCWFPERAAAFIQTEQLPGNVFQNYELGGFTAWRLGPTHGDFIDGRNVSPAVWTEEQELLSSPPDSAVWETESDRRGINILFFPLSRIAGLESPDLMSLCQSHLWRPVYLDEVSIVLLRNRRENLPWIDRYSIDCQTHNFDPPRNASRGELSNFYANAGIILFLLRRYNAAQETLDRGLAIFPEDASIHVALARLYSVQQNLGDAEREFKTALSLRSDLAIIWYSLGRFYASHGRYAEARPLILTAAQLDTIPASDYCLLGLIDVALQHDQQALMDFDKAEEARSDLPGPDDLYPEFFAQIAEGRAEAYFALGEPQRAIELQQEAIRRTPENASRWEVLAFLLEKAGSKQLAEQARQKAQALSQK